MKISQLALVAATYFASGALAHSWVECIDTNFGGNHDLEYWRAHPKEFTDYTERCSGYPRAQRARGHPGDVAALDWIEESSNYSYEFKEQDESGKVLACRKEQLDANPDSGLPVATVTPGQEVLIRYWGNGHGTDNPMYQNPQGRDPGIVRIHWKGKKETPIKYKDELNEGTWIPGAQQAFEKYGVIDFSEDRVDTLVKVGPHTGEKQKRMKEWAMYMKFKVPEQIENGRHEMVWVWNWDHSTAYKGGDQGPKEGSVYNMNFQPSYSTCFSVNVQNSTNDNPNETIENKIKSYDPAVETAALCSGFCYRGGNVENKCDPATDPKGCPKCRMPATAGKDGPDCYDNCDSWPGKGVMCPDTKPKLFRRSHRHRRRHNN